MRKLPKAPELFSEVIQMAITDLELAEKDPNTEINMGTFYSESYENDRKKVCHVCLAGAVAKFGVKLNSNSMYYIIGVGDKAHPNTLLWKRHFLALDWLRGGFVVGQFASDPLTNPLAMTNFDKRLRELTSHYADYEENPERFKAYLHRALAFYTEMEAKAAELKAHMIAHTQATC